MPADAPSRYGWIVWSALVLAVGCGRTQVYGPGFGDAGRTSDAGVGFDAGADGGRDAGIDGGRDAGTDAGSDGGRDAGTDAGTDGGRDAGFDAGTDGGRDAGFDAGTDGGRDAGFDAGTDGGRDAGFDAGTDGGRDAGFDGGTDAGLIDDLVNRWCSYFADTYCDGGAACGAIHPSLIGRCAGFVLRTCDQRLTTFMADAGWLTFDPALARACTQLHVGSSCDGTPTPEVCRTGIFQPNSRLGAPCSTWDEETSFGFPASTCVAGTYCHVTDSCPGRCEAYAAIGTPCSTQLPCDPALAACDSTGTCRAYPPLGGACSATAACAPTAYCSADGGRCAARRVDAGEPCREAQECASPLGCDLVLGRCVAPYSLGLGAACTVSVECVRPAYCLPTDAGPGVCAPPLPLGGACTTNTQCAPRATCAAGVCTAQPTLGQACGNALSCRQFEVCWTAGSCTPSPIVGEACVARTDAGLSFMTPCLTGWCGLVGVDGGAASGRCEPTLPAGGLCGSVAQCVVNTLCTAGTCAPTCAH